MITPSFIERQFPVSKVSKESYKERKAGASQTLTIFGKWWGRKPLVLVRTTILGCLLPATNNPRKDMEIFLKIMSMDDNGLWLRKDKSFTVKELYEVASQHPKLKRQLAEWFDLSGDKPKLYADIDKEMVEKKVFFSLGYDQKLAKCIRPEQLSNLDSHTWNEINEHLATSAHSLQELVQQLSIKRFGKNTVVGDCFCGGGSIPFEAARMGCETYASDLNPIAALLTWAGINIHNSSKKEIEKIGAFQQRIYDKVDKEIINLGIEHNELGDRAFSYLYCNEARCRECGVKVPLAPSWVIGKGTKTVAKLILNGDQYDITVKMGASLQEMKEADTSGTVTSKGLVCPNCGKTTPISVLRHDRKGEDGNMVYGLRLWGKNEFEFRHDDVYNERLYAIKYERKMPDGKTKIIRYYRAPNEHDLQNEEKVRQLVADNIVQWQEQGIVPLMMIEEGDKTNEVIRNRGWTHWHHLFNARQLLYISSLVKAILNTSVTKNKKQSVASILGLNFCLNYNSRLCVWLNSADTEHGKNTFLNQALNTLFNYATRSFKDLKEVWNINIKSNDIIEMSSKVCPQDARMIEHDCTYWITDPPYADAINYHELSEFFISWDKLLLKETFPEWYTDSKRILAVKGDEHFSTSMIEIYHNLTCHMPDNGLQIVMFTHSDPAVWAQLALIMWKAGLKVTAAWNVATETDSGGLKNGNYVKGTVLLILRKQSGNEEAFLNELNADIKSEVRNQIESMQALDDQEDPNFSDPDYVLAAYAASLKVLTSYKSIVEIDLDYELDLAIHDPVKSKVVALIERAKKIAYDFIIPSGFEGYLWKELTPAERFYIKGLESEKNGNYQISTFQEYARGFAISSYSQLMASERSNNCRLKTPVEFAMRTINEVPDFEKSTLRLILSAIHIAIKEDEKPEKGLWHIKNNLADYWGSRDMLKQFLKFLKDTQGIENMPHWQDSARMAEHIYVLVDNDHV